MEELLLNYLKVACRGREFCASSTELGRAIGVGKKTVQKIVSRLRRKKIPICSTSNGYFYAKTAQDIIRTIELLQRMIDGLQADIQSLKACLAVCFVIDGERDG